MFCTLIVLLFSLLTAFEGKTHQNMLNLLSIAGSFLIPQEAQLPLQH